MYRILLQYIVLSVDSPDIEQSAAKGCRVLERAKGTLEVAQLRVDNPVEEETRACYRRVPVHDLTRSKCVPLVAT